jgi:hypothetical protein
MKDLLSINITPLLDIYLFSNTPLFLYKKFKVNPIVINLAKSESIEDISSNLSRLLLQDDLTMEQITLGYTLLVSLTLGFLLDSKQNEIHLDLSKLEWGDRIVEIHNSLFTPTIIRNINPFIIRSQNNSINSSESNQSVIHIATFK